MISEVGVQTEEFSSIVARTGDQLVQDISSKVPSIVMLKTAKIVQKSFQFKSLGKEHVTASKQRKITRVLYKSYLCEVFTK